MPTGADEGFVGLTMNASYTQQSCSYIESGQTRTLVVLIPLLAAIAILVFSPMLFLFIVTVLEWWRGVST